MLKSCPLAVPVHLLGWGQADLQNSGLPSLGTWGISWRLAVSLDGVFPNSEDREWWPSPLTPWVTLCHPSTSSQASPHLPCPGAGHVNRAQDVVGGVDMKLSASSSPGG